MINKILAVLLLFACLLMPAPARAQYFADLEAGSAWASHNTLKIPLEGGSRFSLTDDLSSDAASYARVRVGRRFSKSEVSFLAAPLTLRSAGSFVNPVYFNDQTFAAGLRTEAVYRFNSYRLKYLYEFHRGGGLVMRWGGALKLRHAGITLTNSATSSETNNTGFVPLAAFAADYSFKPGWLLQCDIEALGAAQGRAEDVMLAVSREVGQGMRVRAGYRFLEGGSGAGEVYTFAWINYLLAGFTWEF